LPAAEITRIQELVYELSAADVMVAEVITVPPSAPMGGLRDILRDNRISGTPVLDGDSVVGIISIEDFIVWLTDGAPDCAIGDRMTGQVVTVYEDEPLVRVAQKLKMLGFGRLPVLKRQSGKLTGIITMGDIVAGMLKKLDIDSRRAETRFVDPRRIFEGIVADKSTMICEYSVCGGDHARGGASATGLKSTLLRLGMSPLTARRAAIVTYEAEMNLVFFTEGGRIVAKIDPDMVRIEVEDGGPGIPDVEQAMQPGYSTAPDWVRELGFGAGMGLHNIQTCADRMNIDSSVGKGTRLEVEILPEREDEPAPDSRTASA